MTLQELETHYSVDDLLDLHIALDMHEQLARKVAAKARVRAQGPPKAHF